MLSLALAILVTANPPSELVRLVDDAKAIAARRRDDGGIDQALMAVAERIQAYGPEAIPVVLPLLRDASPGVRAFGGYLIADLPGLTEKELPALLAAHSAGNGWVPRGIASIGTKGAIDYLIGEFLKEPEASMRTQTGLAVASLGPRTALALIETLNSAHSSANDGFVAGVCSLLTEMGQPASSVEGPLLALAASTEKRLENRRAAIRLMACGPPVGKGTRDALDVVVDSTAELAKDTGVSDALMQLGTSKGAALVLARIKKDPDAVALFMRSPEAGRIGEDATIKQLDDPNPDSRLVAAMTLGSIGTDKSHGGLIAALEDQLDWRLVCAAARSLAMIRATEAAEVIRRTAQTHWYPPVRRCLQVALEALPRRRAPEKHARSWEIPDGSEWRWTPTAERLVLPEPLSRLDCLPQGKGQSRGARSPDGRPCGSDRSAPSPRRQYRDGVLVGSDRGEWGGELRWIRDGTETVLLRENVTGIFDLAEVPVVVTGLAHMASNEGAVFRVEGVDGGSPVAKVWRVLPGAPVQALLLKSGALYVSCWGGDIVLKPDGGIALASDETTR